MSSTLAFIPAAQSQSKAPPSADFAIEDFLNRNWTNELVSYPLSAEQEKAAKAGKSLVDSAGQPIPYQLGSDAGKPVICFAANVAPFGKSAYHFADAASKDAATDLRLTETEEWIELANAQTGIRIRKHLADGQGPIAGIKLPEGTWTGGSKLRNVPADAYEAKMVASGPVFAEVDCRLGEKWNVRFRLQAGEPVALIDESFDLGGEAAWEVDLSGGGFSPDRILSSGGGKLQAVPIAPEPGKPFFGLQPWLHWWRPDAGKWAGLFAENGSGLLMVAARDSDVWVVPRPMELKELVPGLPDAEKRVAANPELPFWQEDGRTFMTLPLNRGGQPLTYGRRNWLLGTTNKADALAPLDLKDKKGNLPYATLVQPHEYLIKYEFPLDRVKDYVLEWKETGAYPRLYVTPEFVRKLRETKGAAEMEKPTPKSSGLMQGKNLGSYIQYYLLTGDEEMGRTLADKALADVQGVVNSYVKQPSPNGRSFGMAPHNNYLRFAPAMTLADTVLSGNSLTPEERRRLLAQLAFIAYTINRDDYWSPERGYSNHPNMTAFLTGEKMLVSCLLPSHPVGRTWAEMALKELEQERDNWVDENGGMLETPHYSMGSYDTWVGAFLIAKNNGFDVDIFHPKMKKAARWFASISTPPDSRINGWRHLPPIGNTYLFEATGEFGVLAGIWKDKDPEFASQLKWLHESQGENPDPGNGGAFPIRWGYDWVLAEKAKEVTPKPPAFGSEWFPETTVVLRNHFPSDRETQMVLIAGWNHAHYDKDSGSFVLWGKGRIVADDFGYRGYMPSEQHSLVTGSFADEETRMKIETFASAKGCDYVKGTKDKWTRQIVFVKDEDPLGPNYFVIADSFAEPGAATWRLWSPCQAVTFNGRAALIEGKEDVDTDVFFTRPADLKFSTREETQQNYAVTPEPKSPVKFRFGRADFTQKAVIAEAEKAQAITSVIYPRLKTEKAPEVTAIADGRGVKVVTPAGTDYIFLAPEAFSFEAGGVRFQGTSGVIRSRKDSVTLSLGDRGHIQIGKAELQAEGAAEKAFPQNLTTKH